MKPSPPSSTAPPQCYRPVAQQTAQYQAPSPWPSKSVAARARRSRPSSFRVLAERPHRRLLSRGATVKRSGLPITPGSIRRSPVRHGAKANQLLLAVDRACDLLPAAPTRGPNSHPHIGRDWGGVFEYLLTGGAAAPRVLTVDYAQIGPTSVAINRLGLGLGDRQRENATEHGDQQANSQHRSSCWARGARWADRTVHWNSLKSMSPGVSSTNVPVAYQHRTAASQSRWERALLVYASLPALRCQHQMNYAQAVRLPLERGRPWCRRNGSGIQTVR